MRVRSCIVGDGSVYIWYGSEQTWYQTTAEPASADLAQQIPTYEDVLSLDQSEIAATGYEV
jgi:hypothetical protein